MEEMSPTSPASSAGSDLFGGLAKVLDNSQMLPPPPRSPILDSPKFGSPHRFFKSRLWTGASPKGKKVLKTKVKRPRKEKGCRICGRSVNLDDHVDPEVLLRWGYPNAVKFDFDANEEIVQGKVDWYCNKVHETHPTHKHTKVADIVKMYKESDTFKTDWEMSRDGVIACIMTEGPEVTVSGRRVEKYREIVTKSTFERRKRFKSGTEMSEAAFKEKFKHKPEMIKKANVFCTRVRNQSGKYVIQRKVKVYDQSDDEEYRFEEATGTDVRHETTVDDGSVVLDERQAESAFEDEAAREFAGAGVGLSWSDLGGSAASSGFGRPSRSSGSSAQAKKVEEVQVDDEEDDDELSPFERQKKQDDANSTPKKLGKKNGLGSASSIGPSPKGKTQGGGGGSGGGGVGRDVSQLMEEISEAFNKFKDAKTMDSINLDTLANLGNRAKSKATQLLKKGSASSSQQAADAIDALQDQKNLLAASVDAIKAARLFEKKKNKQSAAKCQEKLLELKTAGLSAEATPVCLAAFDIFSMSAVHSADQRWMQSVGLMEKDVMMEKVPQLGNDELECIQARLASDAGAEFIRFHSDAKVDAQPVFDKLTEFCQQIVEFGVGSIPKNYRSAIIVLNASNYTYDEVQEALSTISKYPI